MTNPIAALVEFIDGLFEDYANPQARRVLHAVLTLAFLLFTVWQGYDGNWLEALGGLLLAGYTQANKANTPPIEAQPYDPAEHEKWEQQPTHVDDIVPRTTEHDESDLYGDGADRGVSGNPSIPPSA